MVGKSDLRIGLIADTHEAENPTELIAKLASFGCDLHIHLGDIGGSRLASRFVREFKQSLGNVDHLGEKDRQCYETLKEQGVSPLWAYIETKLGADSASRTRRALEAQQSYVEVVKAIKDLPNTIMLSGNIDKSLLRAHVIDPGIHDRRVPLVTEPELLDLGSRALILWPSMKHGEPEQMREIGDRVDSFVRTVLDKDQVIVFAHEQIYKGPLPARYKENVESAGYQAMTIPRFEPNPCWRILLQLFRSLRPSQAVAMVYGHVHDPHRVVQAGAPYLKGTESEGLRFRLYGFGPRARSDTSYPSERRTIRLFTIPADVTAILHLTPKEMSLEILP